MTDPRGNTSTTAYSAITTFPKQITTTNPAGHQEITVLGNRKRQPYTITDANGGVTQLRYDYAGRLTTVAQPGDATTSPTIRYTYTLSTNKIAAAKVRTETKQPGGGYVDQYDFYDSLGRHRQTQTARADGAAGQVVTASRYDELGNLMGATQPITTTGTHGSAIQQISAATIQETLTTFDEMSRPLVASYRDTGSVLWSTTNVYHGMLRTVTTPPSGGVRTDITTDIAGRERSRTEGTGSTTATMGRTYDARGNLATITYPDNRVATHTYDFAGRRTTSVDPDTGTSTSTYDNNGNQLTTTRASGQRISTTYDNLNRPLTIRGRNTPTGSDTTLVTYTYDTGTRSLGRPSTETTHHSTGNYVTAINGYTNRGLPMGVTYTYPALAGQTSGTSYTVSQTYSQGKVLTTSYPTIGGLPSETLTSTYTAQGLPSTFAGATSYVRGTTYLADGTLATRLLGHASTGTRLDTTYTHDNGTRRLATVTTTATTGSTSSTVVNDAYTWNNAGNLTRVRDTSNSTAINTCHTYDVLNRLTHSWTTTATSCNDSDTRADGPGAYNTRWSYNAVGNITGVTRHLQSASAYTYGNTNHPHAVTKAGNTTYTYTTDGQAATKTTPGEGTDTYAWDLLGNLSSVTRTPTTGPAQTTTLIHGASGTRHARLNPDGTATIYPGDNHEVTINDGTLTATRYYAHDGHTIATRTPTNLTWQTTD